ncbi:MAG: Holliday junction branch migration protein RuvA [Cytophagaceae bacterium]|nr:Holliday junction branch migration protein RuvA [Cytophagaceae bacterium]MBK9508370.1 Holliday junction branch migration protein RuvA [Cytophagaceae bacterium]MBK9932808.1 Holliday junction branch migration protein RuvA [Cytophagaceae bacterium]MBL0303503.1 Holliday junction branch migration protein RuvA [Cytophagaceae bacterium]
MIAYLNGKIVEKEPTHLVIDVNGVGYFVKISLQTYSAVNPNAESVKIYTVPIIREDSHSLFGFFTKDERELFEHLISVSGIGPSIALVFLSSLSSVEIKQAIISEDLKTIQNIKGIGAKTAQRAIIELKDKLKKEIIAEGINPTMFASTNHTLRSEALSALVTLGIQKATAEKSVDNILKRTGGDISLEELIKLSLR